MGEQTENALIEPTDRVLRAATTEDIAALVACEERCFSGNRLSRRNFTYLLRHAHGHCLVAMEDGRLAGYALVLFKRGISLARLYSFAVDPDFRNRGVGFRLLAASEAAARGYGRVHLRLEVRRDNEAAIAFYRGNGYREMGRYPDYYQDHMEALRLEKNLVQRTSPIGHPVPYYAQTL